jgi:mono/diheme cytochrome c family protein
MLGVTLVLAGLTTGNKIGLAAVGAAFIVFALVSSFLLPARYPNFPGRHVGWYVAAGLLFLVAMLAAVLVFGREKEEASPGESPAHTATVSGSLPGQTTSTPSQTATSTTATSTGSPEPESEPAAPGDTAAGKQVFASAGCGGCHTLQAAGSSGNVGPNLDDLKPDEHTVENQVEHGGGAMPAFKGQLSDRQIRDVAAFVAAATHT